MTEPTAWRRLVLHLGAPVDAASLGAFRFLLGALMAVGAFRVIDQGWVDILWGEPEVFFSYWGASWVPRWAPAGMVLHYAVVAASAAALAVGLYTRAAAFTFLVAFGWIQLMDVTNYLNHYYLVCLLAFLLLVTPSGRALSVDAWRRGASGTVPRGALWLLRTQVAVVYIYAALAKTGTDWLLHGQPMNLWMTARDELPVIGPLLGLPWVALGMSWAGFLYDLSIAPLLLWRRSRPFAFVMVVVFHGLTRVFFDIGMFPFIMISASTLFFAPDWPRQVLMRVGRAPRVFAPPAPTSPRRAGLWMAAGLVYVAVQVLLPLRHYAYPGDVLWNEEGMRFAWKVMVREKSGAITYRVRVPSTGRTFVVSPTDVLTWRQANEMSGQPDLILQLGHLVGERFEARGEGPVEVRVEAWVSLNGRRPQLLIDPEVDLMTVEDTLAPAAWILPGPTDAPPTIHSAGALARGGGPR